MDLSVTNDYRRGNVKYLKETRKYLTSCNYQDQNGWITKKKS